ncbi:MAG: hypothetical protein WD342_02895 [Verrucomicrobiales bacterium]
MFFRLSALLQIALLAGIVSIQGLGAVEFCESRQEICTEAKADSCCPPAPASTAVPVSENVGVDCCVRLFPEWKDAMVQRSAEASPPLAGHDPGFPGEEIALRPCDDTRVLASLPDPPPRGRAAALSLLQIRLI